MYKIIYLIFISIYIDFYLKSVIEHDDILLNVYTNKTITNRPTNIKLEYLECIFSTFNTKYT
jgi:hypothetical protein